MPAKPRWLLAIPDAIKQLEALDQDLLTRRDLERLFGVSKGRAVALMTAFGAGRTGHILTLPRAALLRQLRRHRTRAAFRDRVVTAIRQARLTGIRVAVPREALEARLSGLPAGVSVEPWGSSWLGARRGAWCSRRSRRCTWRPTSGPTRGRRPPSSSTWRPCGDRSTSSRRAQRRCSRRPRARRLLEAIDPGTLTGRRDRALVSVRLYSFARVSAVIGMRRQDYFRQERRGWLRLHETGGTRHDVPAHHRAAEALDDYLARAGLDAATAAVFQSVDPPGRRLTGRTLSRRLVLAMIKRRAAAADLPPSTCCHTFRATGITAYLSNGGTLEHAQQIAGHASPKTTKLYDRTADTITVDEIERIVI